MEEAQDEQEVCLEDDAYVMLEAALTVATMGLDLNTPSTAPVPTLVFSIGGLSDALRTWSASLSSTVAALAWSADEPRHLVVKHFISLLVVKDVVTDGAAHVVSTQWFHWDNPARFEGRLTELDSQDGIVYRFSCNKSLSLLLPVVSQYRYVACDVVVVVCLCTAKAGMQGKEPK